jgi:two-component system, OmpR family, phosphate regulon sensor histidine kinase PhoR
MPRFTLFWQMFLSFGALIVLALGVSGGVVGAWAEQQAMRQIETHLTSKAILLQEIIRGSDLKRMQAQIESLRSKTDTRITLIAQDGHVIAESEAEKLTDLDNHGQRPEVDIARKKGIGQSIRYSATLKQNMLYLAVRTTDLGPVAFVRVSRPIAEVQAQAAHLRNLVWGMAAGTAVFALLLTGWLTRRMTQPLHELAAGANKIATGDYGHKVYLDHKEEFGQLADSFNHMSGQLASQFAQIDEDRQKLRAILSGMVEGVIAINGDQSILFANERASQMLEFSESAAAGRKLWEIVRQHAVQQLVQAAMNSEGDEAHKIEFTHPAGKSLLLHVAQLAGKPTRGAVLVFHDTTELRRLERLRQDFVANVSHELKTPLSVITACVETLVDGGVDDLEHRGRFLDRIHEQAQRLHTLILDLLSLARIESGEQLLTLQPVSIAEMAHECIERHQARAHARSQHLSIDTPEADSVHVLADIEALGGILDNLIDNAVKYTPPHGSIRLRWWHERDVCTIEVHDTGIGIPESDLPRVFERFYRVDKARSRELGGTGLGLSIVKHLVQSMQGTIRASSELGKGSTFTICLPKATLADNSI